MSNQIVRLFHTARHLRVEQVAGRLRHQLRHALDHSGGGGISVAGPFPGCRWKPATEFLRPNRTGERAGEILAGRMTFLNSAKEVGWPPNWNPSGVARLWTYNLHYFDYLWGLSYEDSKRIALDWIERNPPSRKSTGWEPYPVSLRIQNWCCNFFGRFREAIDGDAAFRQRLWESLHAQGFWLMDNLETHLLGNHYFENGASLALLGACFDGESAESWKRAGLAILKREIPEQILPDGMHYERSPMYHVRMTWLMATLAATGDGEIGDAVREPLGRMGRALGGLLHPDGEIPLFNDSAFGVYNPPLELLDHVHRLVGAEAIAVPARGSFSLPEAGYYGFRDGAGACVVCDAGPIGPDYIPGHAHGDMFSFELSLHGRRVVVDAGVHDYEGGEMRHFCRSTRAHNTVEIDGQDQSEFWGAFRVARRAHPREVRWDGSENGFWLSGWHDGYMRLPGSPRHGREIQWQEPGVLMVRDQLVAEGEFTAVSRIHLHPDCVVKSIEGQTAHVGFPEGEFRISFAGGGELSVEESFYCPEFGRSIGNRVLCHSVRGGGARLAFCLAPGASRISVDVSAGATVDGRHHSW